MFVAEGNKYPKSEAVRRLDRGEITLDDYLDERAEDALAHLKGKLPESTLANLRFVLREKLRTDPVLVEAVRRSTGMTPKPPTGPGR
jgi:hypothetical protein